MTKIALTGARGFIGRHVAEALSREEGVQVIPITRQADERELRDAMAEADVVIHLAGSNRPKDQSEFEEVNVGLTARICDLLRERSAAVPIVFASSTQAELENPYGRSKLAAEGHLQAYAEETSGSVTIFRLTNVFGKWARPNYNSFVATLCWSVARSEPYRVDDPDRVLRLVYVDDVSRELVHAALAGATTGMRFEEVAPVYSITVGELVSTIEAFGKQRASLRLPNAADRLTVSLYATYLSYLRPEEFGYSLVTHTDNRGALAEFVKGSAFGQIFISRTIPGITRGNHYHHTKTEKFLVVAGEGLIRFRHIESDQVIEHRVSGQDFRVVDIPPGYTHSIENVGSDVMVTLFWASEIFDPAAADTYFQPVMRVTP